MTTQSTDPSDRFVDRAQGQMGAIERLLKGLPGVSDYVNKEVRRDADKRLRVHIADQLDGEKRRLLELQSQLLAAGGLSSMGDVDRVVTKLQTLSDRIRTASYGYAGFFDPVRVREDELRALHQFDVAMAARVGEIEGAISALSDAVMSGGQAADAVSAPTARLTQVVNELAQLYDRRSDAIMNPELLTSQDYAPAVDAALLDLADTEAASAADNGMSE